MLQKATNTEVGAYNGELRISDDDREGQILYDYDRCYNLLKQKAADCELPLPPLFEQDLIDHGALTRQNKNEDVTKNHLDTVLNFLERSNLLDLLVPAKGGKGYKVDPNDPRLPPDIKTALTKCSETFCTTVAHKPVRLRFLNCSKLEPGIAKQLKEKVYASHQTYDKWAVMAVDQMRREHKLLGKLFVSSIMGIVAKR